MTGVASHRPNILLIMADQLAAPFLALHGGPAITPSIDALAADAAVFESAYCNSPLCAPSRFSMMSGRLASEIGAYDNAAEFAANIPTFAHHLRAGGYQTSLVGKMHFVGPDQLHGYEERLTTDIYPADFGWTPDWSAPDHRFDWWFHNMDSVLHAGVADVSNQLDFDDEVGFQAVRKLRDLARTTDPRPWHVTVSFTHPHDPYVARPEFWDRYADVDVPMPSHGWDDVEHDAHSVRVRSVIAADRTEMTDEQIRAARRAYLANISYVDHWVGELLAVLDRHGMADDTVVVFTADHGDALGERGLWYKMTFFEHAARVPLVVRAPGRVGAGRIASHVSLVDIAPTLLDLAGLHAGPMADDRLAGASVLPLAEREEPDRTVVGDYCGEGSIAPVVMLRRGRWKYIASPPDPPLLFDLESDPHELRNLATTPSHAAAMRSFAAEVDARWDLERLDRDVRSDQAARAVVDRAMRQGRFSGWDYQPSSDASQQYMRNHLDLNEVESGRRR